MSRILFLSTMDGSPWGGSELLWAQTAERLVAMGHEVHACTMAHPGVKIPALEHLQAIGVHRTHWHRRHKLVRLLARTDNVIAPHPERLLGQVRPDLLVISNGYHLPPVHWTDAAQRLRIPYAHVAHCFLDYIWPAEAEAKAAARALEHAAAAFWVSEGNQAGAFRQLVATAPISEVVRNPYKVSRDIPFRWPEVPGLRLAFVGRLNNKHKGCDLLVEALRDPKWRERDVSLTFYGTGEDEARLKRLVSAWQLEERIRFAGHVSDIDAIWDSHHALALTSRHEGLPVVIVEAMLRGRPCVVTDVAGNAELIEDGLTGFVAAGPNVRAIDAALERAWQARGQLREAGQAAYEQIRTIIPADPAQVFADRLISLLR